MKILCVGVLAVWILGACSGGTSSSGTTVTAADGDAWTLARRAETAMREGNVAHAQLRDAVVKTIRGGAPVPPSLLSAVAATDAKLADLDAKLDIALTQRAPQGHAVSRALLLAAVIFRRAQVTPFETTVPGLADVASCGVDVAADHLLLDHLLALAERRLEEASIYLARIDQTIRCLSLHQIWFLDAQLAIALESLPALGRDEARATRAHMLPLLLVVLDASKLNGTTPLMQHLSGHLGEYLDAGLVEQGLVADFGIWLHDPRRGHLAQFPSLCELPAKTLIPAIPRCVQLGALLDALTNPERLGTGECAAFAMITAGMTTNGGYACRGGQCAAANAGTPSLGDAKPAKPAIDRLVAGGSRTLFGFDIPRGTAAATAASCGSGGAGGGGGRGAATAGQHSCAIASLVAEEATNIVAGCAAEAVEAAGQIFQIPPIQLATRHVSPTCMRAGGAADKTPEQKERDQKAKDEAKNALDNPEVQQKIRDQLKAAYGREPTQAEMNAAIAAAKKAIDDAVVDRDKGLPGKAGNTQCRGTDCHIVVDGKKTDTAAPMIYEVMFHEGLHVTLQHLGAKKKDHEDLIAKSGLGRPSIPSNNPYPGQFYLCAPDSQCVHTCNPASAATIDIAGCVIGAVVDSATPEGKPSNVDPSPLDPPQVTSALSKCFRDSMNVGINKVPPQCMAVDCGPDASATLNAAGICTCGANGTPGKLRPQLMAQCNAMRCEGGMPTAGPIGCTCAASMGKLGKLSVTPVTIRIR